ncbi:MAG TPA: hypothetical protein VHF22_00095, partial [Planctomycetota bacterium]|nr:hypothetical protein [Planctomycetota bacterium]
ALMLWMNSEEMAWCEFRGGEWGEHGSKRFKTIGREVELAARIEAGALVVMLDGFPCFSRPWPRPHLRGLGLYVDDGTATFSNLRLRKARG